MTRPSRTFADLPLYASPEELAEAVVGKARAREWVINKLPELARMPGWPAFDPAHGGYYSPAVKAYYDARHGLGARALAGGRDEVDPSAWQRPKRRAAG